MKTEYKAENSGIKAPLAHKILGKSLTKSLSRTSTAPVRPWPIWSAPVTLGGGTTCSFIQSHYSVSVMILLPRMCNDKITPSKSEPGQPESRPSLQFGQTYNHKGRFLAMRIRNEVPWFLPPFIPPVHHRHNSCQFLEPLTAHNWRRSKTKWSNLLTVIPRNPYDASTALGL